MKITGIGTLVAAVVVVMCLWLPAYAAPECQVPATLKQGGTYTLYLSTVAIDNGTVLEIDKQSCWFKVRGKKSGDSFEAWINLNVVEIIQDLGSAKK